MEEVFLDSLEGGGEDQPELLGVVFVENTLNFEVLARPETDLEKEIRFIE